MDCLLVTKVDIFHNNHKDDHDRRLNKENQEVIDDKRVKGFEFELSQHNHNTTDITKYTEWVKANNRNH